MRERTTIDMRFTAIFLALPHLLGLKEWYCAGKSALDARLREINSPELRDFLDGSYGALADGGRAC